VGSPGACGTHDDLDGDPEYHDVGDHLAGNQEARQLRPRGDVTESDSREDGDGEVQRVAPGEWLAEIARSESFQDEVGAGEQQQE
jgi:hypothetical protein